MHGLAVLRRWARDAHRARALSTSAPPHPPPRAPALDSAVLVYGALSSATAALCLWQLHRYDWKLSILAERRALLAAPPVDISRGPCVWELRGGHVPEFLRAP